MNSPNTLARWLTHLSADARAEVAALFDERLDDVALARMDDGHAFAELPIVLAGTLVDTDEEGGPGTWHQDFYEYAADQKYVFIGERKFHICSREASARAALCRGVIPATFACSAKNPHCPMRRILAAFPGCSVELALAPSPRLPSRPDTAGETKHATEVPRC